MQTKIFSMLFWLLATPTGALALFVILMTIAGKKLSAATPLWLALVAGAGVLALLIWAYRLLVLHGRPGLACVITVASWLLFAGVMLVNGLLHQKTWQ